MCLPSCCCESLEHATTGDLVTAITADFQACIEDRMTTHTSGNGSIDTSLICDIHCSPEETCVAMKFVGDDEM